MTRRWEEQGRGDIWLVGDDGSSLRHDPYRIRSDGSGYTPIRGDGPGYGSPFSAHGTYTTLDAAKVAYLLMLGAGA